MEDEEDEEEDEEEEDEEKEDEYSPEVKHNRTKLFDNINIFEKKIMEKHRK